MGPLAEPLLPFNLLEMEVTIRRVLSFDDGNAEQYHLLGASELDYAIPGNAIPFDSFKANLKFQNCVLASKSKPLLSFEMASEIWRNLEAKAKELFALFNCFSATAYRSLWEYEWRHPRTGW